MWRKLHLLLGSEQFPSRLLQRHSAALQGKKDAGFGLYFQLLILETNAHNDKAVENSV